MRNLKVVESASIGLDTPIVSYCLDSDNSTLFFLTRRCEIFQKPIKGVSTASTKVWEDIEKLNLNIAANDICMFEFVVESGSLILAFRDGRIIRIGATQYSPPNESFYEHNCPIVSVKLSPHQDSIILADESHLLVMLSVSGDVLHEVNALEMNESLHKPVGVGWGSKETQFFGLDGRPSQEQQKQEDDDKLRVSDEFSSHPEMLQFLSSKLKFTIIDWRGDGQYVASLTYMDQAEKHILKVWNRRLELQYMSEQLVALELGIIAWIPNGQFVCCAQRRSDTINEVIMFEKNGLVHQRFTLPRMLNNLYIVDLSWSPDSRILAILAKQFSQSDSNLICRPILFLYTMQNFHYYLKYSSYLEQNCDHSIRWDSLDQSRLYIMSSSGHHKQLDINWEISYSENSSTVVVVDANQLKLTPMALCNVPPPMAALTVGLEFPIYKFAINRHKASNIMILTLDGQLISFVAQDIGISIDEVCSFIKLDHQKAKVLLESFKGYRSKRIQGPLDFQHLIVVRELELIAVRLSESTSTIVKIDLDGGESDYARVEVVAELIDDQVKGIVPNYHQGEVTSLSVLLSNGGHKSLEIDSYEIRTLPDLILNITNYDFICAEAIVKESMEALITLGRDLCLRFNQFIISNTCTSFKLTKNYLIYTLADCSLHLILLEHLLNLNKSEQIESYSQPIETGATLVIVDEDESKVVLQMPRGNLEILYPRVLVFYNLIKLLDEEQLVEAVKLARRHRINLNFIYDYLIRRNNGSLESLVGNLGKSNPDLLTFFSTELNSGDTITGQYSSILRHMSRSSIDFLMKPICLEKDKHITISDVLEQIEDESLLNRVIQPRLLCLLKQHDCGPTKALEIVYRRDKLSQADAVRFMLYFMDIDKLFKAALKTHNTGIALMVASMSHKDPKEYLSQLAEFDSISDPAFRNYKMDMSISDYEGAYKHLLNYYLTSSRDKETELKLLELVDDKRLYKTALGVLASYPDEENLHAHIWSSYGRYLFEKRYYSEAGVAYSKVQEFIASRESFEKAIKCFALSDEWEKSFALIKKARLKSVEVSQDDIKKIIDNLMSRGMCLEALTGELGCSNQCHKNRSLFETLVEQGRYWLADYLINADTPQDQKDIRDKIALTARESISNLSVEFSQEYKEAMSRYDRLKELLVTYQRRRLDKTRAEGFCVDDSMSTIDGSELSSVISESSAASQQSKSAGSQTYSLKTRKSSSSNKSRNIPAKRINLKLGSKYEDLALALELKKFITKQKVNQTNCSQLLSALFEYERDFEATVRMQLDVKRSLTNQLELAKSIHETLWPADSSIELQFSLYQRFQSCLSLNEDTFDEIYFQVLMKPEIPKEIQFFEI